ARLRRVPSLRRRSVGPPPSAIHGGGAALAASMPLGPLHATCVQPAPKSRFVVSGLTRTRATRAGANALRIFDACINLLCAALYCRSDRGGVPPCPRSAGNRQQDLCMRCVWHDRVAWFCYRCAADRPSAAQSKRAPTPSAESKAEQQAAPALALAFDPH